MFELLREKLNYDPETGVFTWRHAGPRWCAGDVATKRMSHGYLRISLGGSRYLAHRLAWLYVYGVWPRPGLDHINGTVDDNRIANLRLADQRQNSANTRLNRRNKTGRRGVFFDPERNLFCAQIRRNGKRTHLGRFRTMEEASAAYVEAATATFGPYFSER